MRITHAFLPLVAAGLMLAGCGNKQPATNAVTQADAALTPIRDDAAKYAPDELKAADATLAHMKASLEKSDYKGVIEDVPEFNAQVKTLQEALVTKQTLAAAAQNEWETLNAEVPKSVEAIQTRVDSLSGSKLPKEVTKENFEAAKADLASMKTTWAEATAAATAGNAQEAADKGRTVQAKVEELKTELGMSPALASTSAPASMTPPKAADVTPAN